MQKNNKKQNKEDEDQNKKEDQKKKALAIDYSQFQKKFISNNNSNKEKTQKNTNIKINEEKPLKIEEKNQSMPQPLKNFEHFLNISGILDESQSSILALDNKNNNIIKEDELNQKINKNFINDYLDDISINDTSQNILLSINYKNLINSNINNNKNINENNKKKDNISGDINSQKIKNSLNTSKKKKKNKYSKFLINNNDEAKTNRKNNYNNFSYDKNSLTSRLNKNSYAVMNKKTKKNLSTININKGITNENNSKENNSFNLFNDVNHKHNISNYSEISYNALSTATGDINERPKNRNKRNISSKINSQKNKGNVVYSQFNRKNYMNSYNKINLYELSEDNNKKKKINNINSYNKSNLYELSEDNNKKKKINNINSNLILYTNDIKNNYENNIIKNDKASSKTINVEKYNIKNINKNEGVMNLLDDIKNKFQNKENKYINQQKNMKNEIKILKEKLKTLSANEALYQVEIEKLKLNKNIQNNSAQKIKINKFISNNNQNIFGQQLDDIIQKHNQNKDKDEQKINMHLLEIFGLNKDIFENENIFDENDDVNYDEMLNNYPVLKKFIQMLAKKYKNEKEYRIRLEEKTIEIFMNDIKRINYLEKKIKKLEHEKKFRINSSLDYSYDNDLSKGNISNNSCKSCDKSL